MSMSASSYCALTIDIAILAPARAHEAFQLAIRSGARRRISENFATDSTALILIWRGLAISLVYVMAVLIKLSTRTMDSFGGGGDQVKPIGAASSDKEHMSSINSKYLDYRNTRRRKLTKDAGLSLPEGVRQRFFLLLEELIRLAVAFVFLISTLLLIF